MPPPRALRPKDEPTTSEERERLAESRLTKRRAISSACIPCRKRKSKCDGAMPSCSTCTAVYRTECAYDADSDHRRKGVLKRDLQSLQQQNDALDVIVASLRSLPEDESISLLHSLRSDTSPDVVAYSLLNNVRLPPSFAPQTLEADFSRQLRRSPTFNSRIESSSSEQSRERRTSDVQQNMEMANAQDTSGIWFREPQDADFVDHLLNLYFCWVHPFSTFFSRDHFLHDMSRGRTDCCSAMLVNAVLAFACHYSDRPLARSDSNLPSSAGNYFYAEAKKLLDQSEASSLTTVQALAIMSLRETSHGRDSNGYQLAGRCVRMTIEMGLHLSMVGSGLRPTEVEMRKITFWGVFNLETMCSVSVGRLSQLPRAAADIARPAALERTEIQSWRPYEETNLSMSPSAEQPARPMLFVEHLSKLSELASDMVNTFYAPQERFTSRRLATAYNQYQEWYQNLPDNFRLENTSLPHVLVLHTYYYACVLHLFRPYIKLDLSGANLYPRDTCTYCANEISAIMRAIRSMYGFRRVCLIVTSLLLSASTIHLLNLPAEPSTAYLSQGLQDLQAISLNHRFAARCDDIVRALALKWDISLPESTIGPASSRFNAQRQQSSPLASTFWAASIPRNPPSGSSTRSHGSTSSKRESSFSPPNARSQPSVNAVPNYAGFLNDLTSPLDAAHPQFWTPFPGQTMPLHSQQMLPSPLAMDFASVNDPEQWHLYANSDAATDDLVQQHDLMSHAVNTGAWSWQSDPQHQQQQQQQQQPHHHPHHQQQQQ